jgi:16S rRNA (adenine1518-N6/adenine1519-N6)-dimethyltransferase
MTDPEPTNANDPDANDAEANDVASADTPAESVYHSPKNPPRQTASYLSKRLMAAGLRPVSHFGQNFLIDLNLIDLIARSAELRPSDVVLEIGTGVGSLTTRLSDNAGAVLTVEIDHNLHQLASEELGGRPNVKLLQCDALKNKNTLRPEIMENIRDAMERIGDGARFMLVANLPYNVATPIISNLLHELPPPDRMVVTIQKELAERMCATPRTKDYSALSVWVQSLCKPQIVRVLPPKAFWPRPKVESAILRLDLVPEWREKFADLKHYHETIRSFFFHRRKFLRSVVISAMKGRLDKPAVDKVLQSQGHGETARAEELTVQQLQDLAEALRLAELGNA